MKGKPEIIKVLNEVLTIELTSINQYFLHARMYKNWGFEVLNEKCFKKSIKDMKQADDVITRILFLEGLPNLQMLGKINIGENPQEMLKCDIEFQLKQIPQLKQAIVLCEQHMDFVSRDLLAGILDYEEDYYDWQDTQAYQLEQLGVQNYLQAQVEED
ncbi:MAG: bacterioferritin [Glaciecola sp.]|jgi:bacterioferritin